MKALEIILKIGSLVVMVLMAMYGSVLALTGSVWDAPGRVGLVGRLFGVAVVCYSGAYIIPNRTISRTKTRIKAYLLLTSLPIIGVLASAISSCVMGPYDSNLSITLCALLVFAAGLGQAPVSLLVHMRRKQKAEQPLNHSSPSAQGPEAADARRRR